MRAGLLVGGLLAISALCPGVATAGPALLFEANSGKVLYAEDQDNLWHPASLTKIMTAYVVFSAIRDGELSLTGNVISSETAALEPASKIGLPIGAELPVEVAIKALIVKSANDVAVMLAEAVSGNVETFVGRMNATARKLGMTRTHFVNPNGLPAPEQVTTARDLAKLSRAIIRDFPQYSDIWALPSFHIGKLKLASHNSLLRTFEGADGLKTGFICDSGFNVVASATRNGTRLMAVVLGEPSSNERSLRAASLLEHGFQHIGWKTFFDPTDIDNLPLDAGASSVVSVRDTVLAWDCGYRPKARSANKSTTLKSRAARAKMRLKSRESAQNSKNKPKGAKATEIEQKAAAEKKPATEATARQIR